MLSPSHPVLSLLGLPVFGNQCSVPESLRGQGERQWAWRPQLDRQVAFPDVQHFPGDSGKMKTPLLSVVGTWPLPPTLSARAPTL